MALLRNVRNIGFGMEKEPIFSVTYENERISVKNSLPYIKCVLHLSCVAHGPIYDRFVGCTVNGFLSIHKGLPSWRLQRSGPTDPPKENGRNFVPTAPIASKLRLGNTR